MSETSHGSSKRSFPPDQVPSTNTEAGDVPSASQPTPSSPAVDDQPTVISGPGKATGPSSTADVGVQIIAPRLEPGSRIAEFELQQYIGGGGMGRVFRAYDTRLNRVVTLKVLSPSQTSDPQTYARFENEARSAARLNHPGIAQVYSAGMSDGTPYIAIEYVEGANLRKLVEAQGPLSVREAVSYTLQVAEALDHASRRFVVHRDIKPSNILVTPDGRTKLIDLGLAKIHAPDGASSDLTSSGVTLGTFDYIAPEQARDPRVADSRSDIYSLGCTLFFMLTGRPPFPGGTVLQKLLQHQGDEPPSLSQFRSDVPEEIARVLRKMMAKNPRNRYQTPSQLVRALGRAAVSSGIFHPGSSFAANASSARRTRFARHLPWMISAAALVILVIALDWMWTPHRSRPLQISPPLPGSAAMARASPGGENNPVLPSPQDRRPLDPNETEVKSASSDRNGDSDDSQAESGPATEAGSSTPRVSSGGSESDREGTSNGGTASGGQASSGGSSSDSGASDAQRAAPETAPTGASGTAASGDGAGTRAGSQQSAPDSPAISQTPLTVDPQTRLPGVHRTLESAIAAAAPNQAIELDFDGQLPVSTLDLRGRRIEIRAAPGRWPTLVFGIEGQNPLSTAHTRVLASGAELAFEDVAFEFELPPQLYASAWSFFQIDQGSRLAFDRCSLTIRNTDYATIGKQQVAFFLVPGESESQVLLPIDGRKDRITLSVSNSVLRGEAALVDIEIPTATDILLDNCFVAIYDPLLTLQAAERVSTADADVRVSINRCTSHIRGGLCRIVCNDRRSHPVPVDVQSEASIFVVSPSSSFVEHDGVLSVEEALASFAWKGNRNYYEQFTDFWTIRSSEIGIPPLRFGFDRWETSWTSENEQLAVWGAVPWAQPLPPDEQPYHERRPEQYALADPLVDDTAFGVTDQVGVAAEKLPTLAEDGEGEREGDLFDTL